MELGADQNAEVSILGWETSVSRDRLRISERIALNRSEIKASLISLGVLLVIFLISCWLAGNPFASTQRIGLACIVRDRLAWKRSMGHFVDSCRAGDHL